MGTIRHKLKPISILTGGALNRYKKEFVTHVPLFNFPKVVVVIIIIIKIIINPLFLEDDILSKYNYLSNIWSFATKTKQIIWTILYNIHMQ